MPATATLVGLAAFVLGIGFGFVVERTGFCTMGAVSDVVAFNDWRRARSWVLALGVAALGTELLRLRAGVDLDQSIYLGARLGWAGSLLGGSMMGFGMVLAGGCVSRNLVRLGAGDLRSLVVLIVLGVFAYMTQHGLTALPRVALERATDLRLDAIGLKSQGLPELASSLLGFAPGHARTLLIALTGAALLLWCLIDTSFRTSASHVVAGIGVGLAVVVGWWITGVLGNDPFEPARPTSLSFTAPVGNAIVYLMTFTGSRLDFGIALVGGTVLGAFVAARLTGGWRVSGFADLADLMRNLTGAAMMGVGGVVALGCSIGQGITGASTLALGSVLATGAIVAGATAGVRFLLHTD
jgi:uncharacterized protein